MIKGTITKKASNDAKNASKQTNPHLMLKYIYQTVLRNAYHFQKTGANLLLHILT